MNSLPLSHEAMCEQGIETRVDQRANKGRVPLVEVCK
jgi:hypothetical protein